MNAHPALVIAAKDLRQRLRDRSAIVMGFIAPVGIAGLMSVAFSATANFHVNVGYAAVDRGPVAATVGQALHDPGVRRAVHVETFPDERAVRQALEDKKVQAGLVVPDGFSAAVTSGAPAHLEVLTDVDNPIAGQVTRSVAEAFVSQLHADRLSVGAAIAAGAPTADVSALADKAGRLRLPVSATQRRVSDRELTTIDYVAPGMGIFFVLFAVGFTARSWFLERTAGTLDRIAAAPMGYPTVLVGKALGTFGYALASLATMATVSTFAFGADWGDPLAVAALLIAMSVAVVALTTLVIVSARTERQADGLASLLTFALALAGGNFVFLSVAPPLLRRLALFTPNGWALRGFTDLATGQGGLSEVAAPVAGIAACTVVVALVTAALARGRGWR